MKKVLKFVLWIILVIFISIQFVPINRENPVGDENADLLIVTQAPEEVRELMKNACYDCHSNETVWPWYSYVAPVSFIIAEHVKEGREHLNFSDWVSKDTAEYLSVLKHMKKEIDKNAMPLAGYVKLHSNAKMTDDRKELILNWIDSISNDYNSNIE